MCVIQKRIEHLCTINFTKIDQFLRCAVDNKWNMNSKCAKRIFTSSRSSSWHQLLSSLILLSITIESKHFFSQQMENLTQTQKCLWLSHIVTFPKKLSKKVVQIKVSVFNSLKLVMILSAKSCIGEYWKKGNIEQKGISHRATIADIAKMPG